MQEVQRLELLLQLNTLRLFYMCMLKKITNFYIVTDNR